jgi:hypothetical protein
MIISLYAGGMTVRDIQHQAHPVGLPASALALNPNSMPNAYDLLDNKLLSLGLVRCDDGYPRNYYLGSVFERRGREHKE